MMSNEEGVETPNQAENDKLKQTAIFNLIAVSAFGLMAVYYSYNFYQKYVHLRDLDIW